MSKRTELVNDFLDEVNNHDFICGARFNLDEEQPLSIRIADKDDAPIFEINLQYSHSIHVFDYYSKFRVISPSRNKWMLQRLAALMDGLREI